jgi:hypothetical protein
LDIPSMLSFIKQCLLHFALTVTHVLSILQANVIYKIGTSIIIELPMPDTNFPFLNINRRNKPIQYNNC